MALNLAAVAHQSGVHRGNIQRGRQIVNYGIQYVLHAFVAETAAAEDWSGFVGKHSCP